MRTLCWGKLVKDYCSKSLLFLAFIWSLFIQIFEAIFLLAPGTRTCTRMKEKAEEKGGRREGKKTGPDKRRWEVWVGAPSTQRGPDVDNSMSEQVTAR